MRQVFGVFGIYVLQKPTTKRMSWLQNSALSEVYVSLRIFMFACDALRM